jgi:hypothetical protein
MVRAGPDVPTELPSSAAVEVATITPDRPPDADKSALGRRIVGDVTRWLTVGLVAAAVGLAGCSSSSSATRSSTPATAIASRPAGVNPSESAKMVCQQEAQSDLAESLGVAVSQVTTPTWADHLYTCTYQYPNGSFTMAVKELDNRADTTSYFNALAALYGQRPGKIGIGQGAFVTTNGNVVVRKDYKVLYVDTSGLPVSFGQPPQDPSDNALSVAATIMSCWSGA